jgi:hypothetical protein
MLKPPMMSGRFLRCGRGERGPRGDVIEDRLQFGRFKGSSQRSSDTYDAAHAAAAQLGNVRVAICSAVVLDHHLHRQLVLHGGEELAHEHVEAAVAAQCNDLARAIERLDAVGLA